MISVILPVRDGMPWLEDQLRALAAQKCDEPWEVVVADNGSTDGSRELAAGVVGRSTTASSSIDASAVHRGARPPATPASGRPGASSWPSATPTTCVHAGWLAGCVAGPRRTPTWWPGCFDFWSLNGIRAVPAHAGRHSASSASSRPAWAPTWPSAARPSRTVGGFTEELLPGEDIDLCWRLQLDGLPLRHRLGRGGGQAGPLRVRRGVPCRPPPTGAAARCSTAATGRPAPAATCVGAAKSWTWLALSLPLLLQPSTGAIEWARTAGMRLGRLVGSLRERVFFP